MWCREAAWQKDEGKVTVKKKGLMMFRLDFSLPQAKGRLVYRSSEFSLDTLGREPNGGFAAVVNEVLLDASGTGQVCCVWGLCPDVSWQQGKVPLPKHRPGALILEQDTVPGVSIGVNEANNRWPVVVDSESGWMVLAPGKVPFAVEAVEFLPNCLAAVDEDGDLVCLWLRPTRIS